MISIDHQDGVAVVRLSQGKANLVDLEFCRTLGERLNELTRERGVVLVGHGSIFSAGVDLVRLADGGADYVRAFLPAMHDLFERLLTFPRPLVAAVNGHAIAGGAVIVATADRRIAVRGVGRIGVPELRVGVPFPVPALEIMRRVVPPHHLDEVVLGGGTFTPEAALERGLVDEIVDDAEALVPRAVEVAADLASLAPSAFESTKAALRAPTLERIRACESTDRAVEEIWVSPATQAAIRAYVDRTLKRAGD